MPGSYVFDNVGDVAMTQVAVSRLREAFLDAELRLFAASQALLEAHGLGDTTAISEQPWFVWSAAVSRWQERVPLRALRRLPDERPSAFLRLARPSRMVSDHRAAAALVDEITRSDLVVMPGQGTMHDGSDRRARRVAALALCACALRVPFVAVGQGIGPLQDRALARRVSEALGSVHGLGVRDPGASADTVAALGLDDARWRVTGDDAIEAALGHQRAGAPDGDRIGVSLRDNRAAGVPDDLPAAIGRVIGTVRPGTGVDLISMMEKTGGISDSTFLAAVDPGHGVDAVAHPARADAALAALAGCRVVITGTYHAAVFAQTLGVPVVCLAATPYYVQKMRGVLDQFGGRGGTLLDPSAEGFEQDLAAAIEHWWEPPAGLADELRATGSAQADAARRFFFDRVAVADESGRA